MKYLLFFLSFTVSAATTGQLTLTGVIPEVLALSVSPEAISSNLDLTSTQSDLLVAVVNEVSNSNSGYKITISSLNDGNLKLSGGSVTIPYTLTYDNLPVTLSGSSVAPIEVKSEAVSGIYNHNSPIEISYTGAASEDTIAGSYSDILTFEISSN